MRMSTWSEDTRQAARMGTLVTVSLVLILAAGMAGAEDRGFSAGVLSMREAARQAGVPEHELPLETPEESRRNKATREPWENKSTSAVRHVVLAMTRDGVTSGERRSEAPRYSTATGCTSSRANAKRRGRTLVRSRSSSRSRYVRS